MSRNLAEKMELFADQAGLCIVDIQEKLAATMPEKVLKGTLRNCLNLIDAARVLQLPILVSEQFPKGLGRTLPVVAESVLRLPREQVFLAGSVEFSLAGVEPFAGWIEHTGRTQWILSGMETHIGIFQTARGLTAGDLEIFVPRDAVVSRTMANWEIGLQLIERCGAVVTSTEAAIFDLIKRAGTPGFDQLSRIIK
jgi:hypothetical protein